MLSEIDCTTFSNRSSNTEDWETLDKEDDIRLQVNRRSKTKGTWEGPVLMLKVPIVVILNQMNEYLIVLLKIDSICRTLFVGKTGPVHFELTA
jgi:hypothetical protein